MGGEGPIARIDEMRNSYILAKPSTVKEKCGVME
jgi:hypothetical protein